MNTWKDGFCIKHFLPVKIILAAVLAVVLLSGCSQTMHFSIKNAARLNLQSGKTGKAVDITDAETIKKVTDNMNQPTFKKGNHCDTVGWSYHLSWYDKSGKSIEDVTVLSNSVIDYKDYFYNADSGKLDTALYDQLLKSAKDVP